jgi:hypothetical protein
MADEQQAASISVPDSPQVCAEEEKHIHTQEQFKAVINFIVDNHHATKEIKDFSKNFQLNAEDEAEVDRMVKEGEPVFAIVYEILQRHHKNSTKHPSLKSIAQIFTKMGLQKLAGVYLNLFTKNTITRRHEF